ncbi:MAG TPA: TetR/AcrR family transcriptional regulator [Streptosporangiaceae bacterium]|nr:TetR/AcrR family transcriptional regulator [Streptosporangiaceae bacterium]
MPRRQPVPRAAGQATAAESSTKGRIEQAALELFAAKGFEATGIRDIADRAGLSTAALYHYMGSKDELLVAFMVESMTELIRAARAAIDGCDDPAGQLAALVRTHVGFHTLDAQRSLVADDELRAVSDVAFTKVMQLRDGYELLWAETLDSGARSGEFSFVDARITRLALLEMCNGVARWYSDRGPKHPSEIADCFADLALSMVGATRSGQPVRLADLRSRPTAEILALVETELRGSNDSLDAAVIA